MLLVTSPGASADTATPQYTYEGYFARNRTPAPQVDIPCTGTSVRPQCGPASATGTPTPQAPDTGAYVVSSAGGSTDPQSDASGDTAWAAYGWDVFGQLGATVEKFVVTLTQTPRSNDSTTSRRNDTYEPGQTPPPPIQACNIVVPWSAGAGSNAWEDRPQIESLCVAPTVEGAKFTFDVTSLAQSWVEGKGHGMVIRPGRPGGTGGVAPTSGVDDEVTQPFQITFSGYETTITGPTRDDVLPKVTFEFTPAPEDDGGLGNIGGGGGGDFFEETITSGGGGFDAVPELDVIPTDVGSEPVPEVQEPSETAAPVAPRTSPISRDVGFPWIALVLLPFIAIAFWGTGTALGPVGDPVPAREGGVTRVLARRSVSTELDAR